MGWSIGYDFSWKRDIGYGVPAICDHPACSVEIDRGLSYVCGQEACGGDKGCGLYFCEDHLFFSEHDEDPRMCEPCCNNDDAFDPKPDTNEWINWKLTDESWQKWRDENPGEAKLLQTILAL